MYNLFLAKNIPSVGQMNNLAKLAVKTHYDYNNRVITDYWARSAFRVENSHILIQVLRSLSFEMDKPFTELWSSLYARAPYVAKHYGFVSPISFGRPLNNVFYGGKGFREYLLAHPLTDVDMAGLTEQQRSMSPVKVLYHPVTDFHCLILNGYDKPYTNNYSVVQVDVALLAFQFHLYKKEQRLLFGENAILTPGAFLTRELFPKLTNSHIDLCIINNLFIDASESKKLATKIPHNPFSLISISGKLLTFTSSWNRSFANKGQRFDQMFNAIPALNAKNGIYSMMMPTVPRTYQVEWLLYMARFRWMFEFIRTTGDKGIRTNSTHISKLKADLREFRSDRGYDLFKDNDLKAEFLYFADYVKNL